MEEGWKDLLALLFQRADATQTFWNFYAGAVAAVPAFVTAGRPEWLNRFLVFVAGNLSARDAVRQQRHQLTALASSMKGHSQMEKVVKAVALPTKMELWLFHGSLDLAVLLAIRGVPYARRRYELKRQGKAPQAARR
jgi:hypothetical protein